MKFSPFILLLIVPGLLLIVNTCSETSADSSYLFSNYEAHEWETDLPQSHGLNADKLEIALGEAHLINFIHSLLIVKNGKLVLEEYFNGYKREDPHVIRSVSKSILSVLVGFALNDRKIGSPDDSIYKYIPDLFTTGTQDKLRNVTIRNLLEMKSGIKRDIDFYNEAFNSSNWVKTILSEELIAEPGTEYNYSTAATHILVAALTHAIGEDLLKYADRKLFDPLGIQCVDWEKDPQGNYFGGNNMFFVPRDIAYFGQVILDDGMVDNNRLIKQEWLNESFTDTRKEPGTNWGELKNIGYGFLWWLGKLGEYDVRLAIGHGGQYIIMIPEIDMLIVTTCEAYINWDDADRQERRMVDLVVNFILPAVSK